MELLHNLLGSPQGVIKSDCPQNSKPRVTTLLAVLTNVCSAEKLTKRSTVLLLRLVSFSAEQTLVS